MGDKAVRALNFDLRVADLKKYYSQDNHTQAYQEIKTFLTNNGFEWRQGSGYLTTKEVDIDEVLHTIRRMAKRLTWLNDCCEKMDVTRVDDIHDLKDILSPVAAKRVVALKRIREREKKRSSFSMDM